MSKDVNVLLIESSDLRAEKLAGQMRKLGYNVVSFTGIPSENPDILKEDIVIAMINQELVDGAGKKRFGKILEKHFDAAIIFIVDEESRIGSINHLVDRIYDYLLVPASDSHLKHVVDIAVDRRARYILEKYYQNYLEGQVSDQLQHLADQQMRLLHADRLSSIGQVAAGIIHELNNPLTYMKLNLETMDLLNAETCRVLKEYAKEHKGYSFRKMNAEQIVNEFDELSRSLEHGITRIEQVLGNMRRYSRKTEHMKTEFDLHQAISNALNFARGALKKNIVIKNDFCSVLPSLMGDPQKMEQVFLNLLINASHALEDVKGAEVLIKTEKLESNGKPEINITVSDNGSGIRPEIVGRVFDPFFTTKPKDKGTGLGLSICREIITEFSGTIEVGTNTGEGTTFILSLPLATRI